MALLCFFGHLYLRLGGIVKILHGIQIIWNGDVWGLVGIFIENLYTWIMGRNLCNLDCLQWTAVILRGNQFIQQLVNLGLQMYQNLHSLSASLLIRPEICQVYFEFLNGWCNAFENSNCVQVLLPLALGILLYLIFNRILESQMLIFHSFDLGEDPLHIRAMLTQLRLKFLGQFGFESEIDIVDILHQLILHVRHGLLIKSLNFLIDLGEYRWWFFWSIRCLLFLSCLSIFLGCIFITLHFR